MRIDKEKWGVSLENLRELKSFFVSSSFVTLWWLLLKST
jgi:hypothetical protein